MACFVLCAFPNHAQLNLPQLGSSQVVETWLLISRNRTHLSVTGKAVNTYICVQFLLFYF